MEATEQPSISSQHSIIIEDLLNEIVDDVIATAVHRQLSTAGSTPAAEKSGSRIQAASAAGALLAGTAAKSWGGAAVDAADLIAPQYSSGAVCVLDASIAPQSRSSITLLKEGVDCNCDTEFGLESLEAEGPADSWLVDADSAALGANPSRVLCKGPSWDRFVAKMKSAGEKDDESCKQQPRSTRSSAGSIKEESLAEAAGHEETTVAAFGSRSSSLAGKSQGTLSRSNSCTAQPPRSAAASMRASMELASSESAAAQHSETQSAGTEPSSSLLRRSSRPLSSNGASKSRPMSAEQAAAADALRSSFDARRSERMSSGGGSHETDSWSKSLRSRAPASTSTEGGTSQRRLGSSSAVSSPATPARASAAGRLTRSISGGSSSNISSSPAAPHSASRASPAAGKLSRSHSAKSCLPSTPPGPSSSSSTPASRGASSKYSLRSRPTTPVGPGAATHGGVSSNFSISLASSSNPTSPLGSPRKVMSVARSYAHSSVTSPTCGVAAAMPPKAGPPSPRKGYTAAGSVPPGRGKVSQVTPPKAAGSTAHQRHTTAAASPAVAKAAGSAARSKSASIAGAVSKASLSRQETKAAAAAAAAAATVAVKEEVRQEAAAAAAAAARISTESHTAPYNSNRVDSSSSSGSTKPGLVAAVPASHGSPVAPAVLTPKEGLWAADSAAVQLFMDEYKEVLQAIDMAYSGSGSVTRKPAAAAAAAAEDDEAAAGTTSAEAAAADCAGASIAKVEEEGQTLVATATPAEKQAEPAPAVAAGDAVSETMQVAPPTATSALSEVKPGEAPAAAARAAVTEDVQPEAAAAVEVPGCRASASAQAAGGLAGSAAAVKDSTAEVCNDEKAAAVAAASCTALAADEAAREATTEEAAAATQAAEPGTYVAPAAAVTAAAETATLQTKQLQAAVPGALKQPDSSSQADTAAEPSHKAKEAAEEKAEVPACGCQCVIM